MPPERSPEPEEAPVHPVRLRLTVLLSTVAATAALGTVLAPAASADHAPSPTLYPGYSGWSSGSAQSVLTGVPPFGRKL